MFGHHITVSVVWTVGGGVNISIGTKANTKWVASTGGEHFDSVPFCVMVACMVRPIVDSTIAEESHKPIEVRQNIECTQHPTNSGFCTSRSRNHGSHRCQPS
jgi:hypothetical protein